MLLFLYPTKKIVCLNIFDSVKSYAPKLDRGYQVKNSVQLGQNFGG